MLAKDNEATGRPAGKTGEGYGTLLGSTITMQEQNMRLAAGIAGAYTSLLFAPLSYVEGMRTAAGEGEAPPLENYDALTVEEVSERIGDLGALEVRAVRSYEERHKNRLELLERLDRSMI